MNNLNAHRNLNLDILKMFCVFLVICCHFGQVCPQYILDIRNLAVPVFMILSFYFLSKKIETIKIKQRIYRLFWPLLGWSIVYTLIYCFILDRDISFRDFFLQTITGHSPKLNASMWFSNNLLILTLFFVFLYSFIKNRFNLFLLFLLVFSFFMQYSELNNRLFFNLRYEFKYPLGRLSEMLPFMVTGYFFAKYDLIAKFKEKFIVLWVFLFLIVQKFLFIYEPMGFGYSGIKLLLLAVFLVFIFNAIPLQKIPNRIRSILSFLSLNYLGIYCIHRLIDALIHPFLFKEENLLYCFIIFVISQIVCLILDLIPSKSIKLLIK